MDKKPAPIVAITADVTAGVKVECKQAGMDAYISKPVVENTLREVASRWLILQDKTS